MLFKITLINFLDQSSGRKKKDHENSFLKQFFANLLEEILEEFGKTRRTTNLQKTTRAKHSFTSAIKY